MAIGLGTIQLISKAVGFGMEKSASATSGYSEIYQTKQRSNTELFIILSLFLVMAMVAIVFLFRSLNK